MIREEAAPVPRIDLPSRFMWGRHDPIVKAEWADRLPEYFRDPEIRVAEDAGHFVHYETPGPASAAIAAFFDRVSWR